VQAIQLRGVWKSFKVYRNRAPGLKDRVLFWGQEKCELFWALKDISLDIPKGRTVGIIGRNGSGKSTLLKVISGILHPNRGHVKVNGRVSTLLELGAGFHPDFTGRENIYLNASTFGLTSKEIRERLQDIIDFSELGEFIDNPVRSYSSGMYVRLGFSVAVHTDPEILLVDEVLAVGDRPFQEKCLDRIRRLQHEGKTIVLVSHSTDQVRQLCDEAVWLDQGQMKMHGPVDRVASEYERCA